MAFYKSLFDVEPKVWTPEPRHIPMTKEEIKKWDEQMDKTLRFQISEDEFWKLYRAKYC